MAKRGRKPKPTALKKLEGNPGKRPLTELEPLPPISVLRCPNWLLPEARKEWRRLAPALINMGVLTLADAAYPLALLEIPDPPIVLYAKGRIDLLARPSLASSGAGRSPGPEPPARHRSDLGYRARVAPPCHRRMHPEFCRSSEKAPFGLFNRSTVGRFRIRP